VRHALHRHEGGDHAARPGAAGQVVGLSPEILAYVIFLVTLVILSLASLLGGDRQAIAIRRTASTP